MPEKVTREEKIIELAILKARETIEALRDGEITEPVEMEKVKRPKAEKADKIENQTQKKEGYGLAGDEFNGKLKKMSEREKDRNYWKKAWAEVNENDATIRRLEREYKDGMTPEQEATLKRMKAHTEALYKALTLLKSKKYKPVKSTTKVAKTNEATDRSEDPRDVSFTPEQSKSADLVLNEIEEAMKELSSQWIGATPEDLGKIESSQKKLLEMLQELTAHYGRS